jgi:hypothetical protein
VAVDQDLLDSIASTIADLYREVETAIVRTVAQRLRKDLPLPSPFQEGKLDAIRQLQTSAARILAKLQQARAGIIRDAVARAYRSGSDAAIVDLPASWDPSIGQAARRATSVVPNARLLENLAAALHRDIGRVDQNILRAPVDAYRAVQAGAAARIASGAYTRREASQAVWQRLIDRGITSFTDRSGRTWKLSSYVEMMGRTNIQRAAIQGQTDRLQSLGIDLVYISDNVQECRVCRPFESKVLRRDLGPTGDIQVEHATRDNELVTVHVVDTMAGAMARGLFHPNCRHSASAYLPGVTRLKKGTADPEGDKARQKQRYLERKIRAAKEQAIGALTPEAKKDATAGVRAAQAALRAHLAAHPALKRLPYREQIGAGNIPKGDAPGGPVSGLQPPAQPDPDAAAKASADRQAAEQKARQEAEEQARKEAEAKAAAEEKARREAEEAARQAAIEQAKREAAEEKARKEAQEKTEKPKASQTAKPGKKIGVDSRNAALHIGDDVTVSGQPGRVIGKGKHGAITVEVAGQQRDVSPMTVRSTRPADASEQAASAARKAAIEKQAATAAKVEALQARYGDRLKIQHATRLGPRHAADFAKIPDAIHDVLAGHVLRVDLGEGAITDFMPELRAQAPRGWTSGTMDDVPAAYVGETRHIIVGGGHGFASASTSTAAHESGHALDHALGIASTRADFQALHAAALSQGVRPYYSQAGHAGLSEMFAESFAAWVLHRDDPPAARDVAVGQAIGVPAATAGGIGGRLSAYFSNLLSTLER